MEKYLLKRSKSLTTDEYYRIDNRFANHTLSDREQDACQNAVQASKHVSIQLLPNHHLNDDNELNGFLFKCGMDETSNCMPFNKNMCALTSVYECSCGSSESLINEDVLRIAANIQQYRESFMSLIEKMQQDSTDTANLDCIPETFEAENNSICVSDTQEGRAWKEEMPFKMGLYHAMVHSHRRSENQHRLYVVISGVLREAAESIYNLWFDNGMHLTCKQFIESEEINWLRQTTRRNHNRIASLLADAFSLKMPCLIDEFDPYRRRMCLPTVQTFLHNARIIDRTVELVNCGHFVDDTNNGLVMDTFGVEGFWLFMGPHDNTNCNAYGDVFCHRDGVKALPTKTIRFNQYYTPSKELRSVRIDHSKQPKNVIYSHSETVTNNQYPDERFIATMQRMGFDRNDGVVHLMPLLVHVNDD